MKKQNTSLAFKILFPIVLVGLTLATLLSSLVTNELHHALEKRARYETETLTYSIEQLATIYGISPQLTRIVNALGAHRTVRAIHIVGDEPVKVITSTDNSLINKPINSIENKDHVEDLMEILNNHKTEFHTHEKEEVGEYITPLKLREAEGARLVNAAILIEIDIHDIHEELEEQAIQLNTLILIGMTLICSSTFFILKRMILNKLSYMRKVIDEYSGNKSAPDLNLKKFSNDEIGDLAKSFNEMKSEVLSSAITISAILNNVIEGIITTDKDGNIEGINNAALKTLGYEESELKGKNISILKLSQCLRGSDGSLSCNLIDYRSSPEKVIEIHAIHKNGNFVPVEVGTTEIFVDGREIFVTTLRDITERKAAETKISEAKKQLEMVMQATEDGIWVWDLEKNTAWYSAKYKEMLGYKDDEIPNDMNAWTKLVHPEDKNLMLDMVNQYLSGTLSEFHLHQRFIHKDGSTLHIFCRAIKELDDNGKPIKLIGCHTDITEIKQLQQKAENEAQDKADFLASMSHEIRTPMNGILGITQILEETNLDKQQKQHLKTIKKSADNLLYLINDIMDMSKLEAKKLNIEHTPFDIFQLVEEVAELMAGRCEDKGLEMLIRYEQNLPRFVVGDPFRIRQILTNFISNAIKFTEKGHVILRVDKSAAASKLMFSVEDSGIGIQKHMLNSIFRKYTQAEDSTTRKYGGSGLGLYICKELAEMMGGEIGVESEFGKGSKFWFTCLLNNSIENEETDQKEKLKGIKIIVIDDSQVSLDIISEDLKNSGAEVSTSSSTKQALNMIAKEKFDVMISDYMMPDMNGLELARTIKSELETNMKMILVTSVQNKCSSDEASHYGYDAYLAKPIFPNELANIILLTLKKDKTSSIITRYSNDKGEIENTVIKSEGTKVLLVEDNAVNAEVAILILKNMGCVVDHASNGKEALTKLSKNNEYDLIFMDCMMPIMDGYEATKQIRQQNIKTPVIALTANVMDEDKKKCFDAGMDDFIPKPIKVDEIEKVLVRFLDKEKIQYQTFIEDNTAKPTDISQESYLDKATIHQMREMTGSKFLSILDNYLNSSLSLIDEIKRSFKNSLNQELIMAAHPLKSTSQQIGARKLGEVAKDIELSAKANNYENMDKKINSLDEIYRITISEFKLITQN